MAERELQSLHDTVYDQALVWVNSLKAEQKERIEGHFGPMPGKDSVLQVGTGTTDQLLQGAFLSHPLTLCPPLPPLRPVPTVRRGVGGCSPFFR